MPQLQLPLKPAKATIQERFEAFHAANPRVYEILRDLAFEAKASGLRKVGARMLWEVMRWKVRVETRDATGFKLNDHYPPHYVRLLVRDYPQFDGFFELRKLRTK